MSYYDLCCKNIGRGVRFRTVDGRVHTGFITRATPTHLYYRPFGAGVSSEKETEVEIKLALDDRTENKAKEVQWGYGYGYGYGNAATWAAITALVLLPFFFW
jgi:hypothetical protein